MNVSLEYVRAVLVRQFKGRSYKDVVEIQDMPHFKYVLGEQQPYINYVGSTGSKKFDNMIKNFDINKVGKIKVTKKGQLYLIRDGVHRVALMAAMGYDAIEI
jgi:hypothetical protein